MSVNAHGQHVLQREGNSGDKPLVRESICFAFLADSLEAAPVVQLLAVAQVSGRAIPS